MKKSFTFLIGALLIPFLFFGQQLDWKNEIVGESIFGRSYASIKATAVGPDGRIYSTGYFHGFRATLGNTVLLADSAGFVNHYANPNYYSPPQFPTSLFVACHESNGTLAWAKTITSATGYDPTVSFLWPSFLQATYLSGDKLSFDEQGNLVMAGIYLGNNLRYDGVPFESNAQNEENIRFILAKIAPSGALIWAHAQNTPGNNFGFRVKSLQIQNGNIQCLVFTPDQGGVRKYTVYRFSGSGTALPTQTYQPGFEGGDQSLLMAQAMLADGRQLFGSFVPTETGGKNVVSVLNPDLTISDHHFISLHPEGQSTIQPYAFYFNSIAQLPDGQISLLFSLSGTTVGNHVWKLVVDTDTLDVPLQANTQTIMVRLADPACMKKVALLDFPNLGENVLSQNGNWMILKAKNRHEIGSDTLSDLRLLDRNGNGLQTLPLGNLGISYHLFAEDDLISNHSFSWRNGTVAGCHGSWLFKATMPDPIIADESFTGCLSNRNVVLANEKAQSSLLPTVVFEKEPGQWQVQTTAGTQAEIHLVSMLGQRLQTVKMENGSATFSSKGLPGGMYLLQSAGKIGAETQRFVVK